MEENQIKDRFEPNENPCDCCKWIFEAIDVPCDCCEFKDEIEDSNSACEHCIHNENHK